MTALTVGGCTSTVPGSPDEESSEQAPAEAEGLPPVEDVAWEDCTAQIEQALGQPLPAR